MQVLKKALPIALALTTAVMGTTAHAKSVQGAIDFKVTIPEVLVLYHWDSAHLNLTDAVTEGIDNDADREIMNGQHKLDNAELVKDGSYTITGDVPSTRKELDFDAGKLSVKLQNAWAVRAISSDKVLLTATIQKDTLTNGTSKILVSDIGLTATGANASVAETVAPASLKVASGWKETQGDITFKLDLTQAKDKGDYTSGATTATDKTFLLTLTGN